MKNAILPSMIFVAISIGLFFLENQSNNSASKWQLITIASLDKESFESNSDNKSYADQSAKKKSSTDNHYKWLKKIYSAKALFRDKRWQTLDQSQQKMALFTLAKQRLKKNKAKVAVELLTQLTTEQRQQLDAEFYLALAYGKLGKIQQAIQSYQAVLKLTPSHQSAAINLGLVYKKNKQFAAAIEVLQHAIKISSGHKRAKAHAILASCYANLAQDQQALLHYQKSIEYRPDHFATWAGLAKIEQRLNKPYKNVQKTLNRSVKLKSNHYDSWYKLGRHQLMNLDFKAAFTSISTANELATFNFRITRSLAWTTFELGKVHQSNTLWQWLASHEKSSVRKKIANYMLALLSDNKHRSHTLIESINKQLSSQTSLKESTAEFHYLLFLAKLNIKDKLWLTQYIPTLTADRDDDHFTTLKLNQLARYYENSQQLEQAIVVQQQLVNYNIFHIPQLRALGRLHFLKGNFQQAEIYSDKLLAQRPTDSQVLINQIEIDIELGHLILAKQRLDKISVNNFNSEFIALYGKIAWQQNDWDNAQQYYQQLLILETDNEVAHYFLAQIFQRHGDIERAITEISYVIAQNSIAINARILLAELYCQQGDYTRCHQEANKILKLVPKNKQAQILINHSINNKEVI